MARRRDQARSSVQRRTLKIRNKLGLHARAAVKFVQLAGQFKSEITVGKDGQEANGKSIMGLSDPGGGVRDGDRRGGRRVPTPSRPWPRWRRWSTGASTKGRSGAGAHDDA